MERFWTMVDKIIIDEKNSVTNFSATGEGWAKEATLTKLYSLTAGSNVYLNKLSKNTLTPEEFEKAQNDAIKVSKSTSRITDSGFRNLELSSDKNFSYLNSTLSDSFSKMTHGLSSLKNEGLLGTLTYFSSSASKQLASAATAAEGFGAVLFTLPAMLLEFAGIVFEAYEMTSKLTDEYQKMYENGINFTGGLKGMISASGDLGLSTSELVTSFNQFSGAVTSLGTDRAVKLAKQFTDLNRVSGDLGLSNQEAADAVLEYSDMLRTTGLLAGKSNEELAKGAKDYFIELNQISNLTGKNRKELQKEINDRRKNLDLNLAISNKPKEVREKILGSLTALSTLGPTSSKLVEDSLASIFSKKGPLGAITDPAERLILGGSASLRAAMEAAANESKTTGHITAETMASITDSIANSTFATSSQLTGVTGAAGDAAKAVTGMNLEIDAYKESQKRLADQAQAVFDQHLTNETKDQIYTRLANQQAKDNAADSVQTQAKLEAAANSLAAAFEGILVDFVTPMLPALRDLAAITSEVIVGLKQGVDEVKWGFGKIFDLLMIPIYGAIFTFTKLSDVITSITKFFGYGSSNADAASGGNKSSNESMFSIKNLTSDIVVVGTVLLMRKVLTKMGLGSIVKLTENIIKAPFKAAGGLASKGLGSAWNFAKNKMGFGPKELAENFTKGPTPFDLPGKPTIPKALDTASKGLGGAGKIVGEVEKAEESVGGLTNKLEGVKPSKFQFLHDLSKGIASFGTFGVTKGIGNILLMGAGIAGVLYLTAKAAKQFTDVSWEDMAKAGVALVGLGGSLTIVAGLASKFAVPLNEAGEALGAFGLGLAPVVLDIDGLALAIGGVALAIGEALNLASPALKIFGDSINSVFMGISGVVTRVGKSISEVVDSFTRMSMASITATTDQIERLSKIPGDNMLTSAKGITALKDALADFQPGILKGISNFFGSLLSNDPVKQLQKLADLGPNLMLTVSSLKDITAGYADTMKTLNSIKLTTNIDNIVSQLSKLLSLVFRIY